MEYYIKNTAWTQAYLRLLCITPIVKVEPYYSSYQNITMSLKNKNDFIPEQAHVIRKKFINQVDYRFGKESGSLGGFANNILLVKKKS